MSDSSWAPKEPRRPFQPKPDAFKVEHKEPIKQDDREEWEKDSDDSKDGNGTAQ